MFTWVIMLRLRICAHMQLVDRKITKTEVMMMVGMRLSGRFGILFRASLSMCVD